MYQFTRLGLVFATMKTMKGVNFGGWLVLERFITPSIFKDTDVKDEYSLSLLGEKYRARIRKHHKNFITEADFKWLSQHIELIRIPVGYWIFGDEKPYVKSIEQLDWAFKMAKKYDLKIFIDLHGAPGSQNGLAHSGKLGECGWLKDETCRTQSLDITTRIVERYSDYSNFWGIELLNEPKLSKGSFWKYISYYKKAKKEIVQHNPKLKIFISDWYIPALGLFAACILKVGLDCHFYPSFGETKKRSKTEIFRRIKMIKWFLRFARLLRPIIVGEWSVVMGRTYRELPSQAEKKEVLREYAKLQLNCYEQTLAWFYFPYESEGRGTWSFKDMVEQGIIKP